MTVKSDLPQRQNYFFSSGDLPISAKTYHLFVKTADSLQSSSLTTFEAHSDTPSTNPVVQQDNPSYTAGEHFSSHKSCFINGASKTPCISSLRSITCAEYNEYRTHSLAASSLLLCLLFVRFFFSFGTITNTALSQKRVLIIRPAQSRRPESSPGNPPISRGSLRSSSNCHRLSSQFRS